MFKPSLPPACWSTTRIGPSVPVMICIPPWFSAWVFIAANVLSMNAGSVQEAAAPSTLVRKKWRRVWSVPRARPSASESWWSWSIW